MEPQHDQHQAFPPKYAHLNERVTEAEAQLRHLDQEMDQRPQLPRPEYALPGAPARINQPPQRSREAIQQEKDELKATVYQEVERATIGANPQQGKAMQDHVFGRLYREDIDQLKARDGLADPATTWTMDQAQITLLNKAKLIRDQQRGQPEARTPDEMTDRFQQHLDVFQAQERADREPEH